MGAIEKRMQSGYISGREVKMRRRKRWKKRRR